MIAKQQQPAEAPIPPGDITSEEDQINLGAQLLKLALDYDEEVSRGLSHRETLSIMQRRGGMYNPYLINVLEKLQGAEVDTSIKEITVDELHTGMIADQDILARGGLLLVHKGQEVTHPILIRLRHFAEGIGVVEPFRVRAPTQYR